MLKLLNIQAGYTAGSLILENINLEILKGEILGVVGLNGSGKSTLGKAIMNLVPYRNGQVFFNGKDISKLQVHQIHNAGIEIVMQGGRIFQNMTVLEHLQLVANGKSDQEIKSQVAEMGERFELNILKSISTINQKAGNLSGGQKQELALSLSLINNPEILILDELSAGLSPLTLQKIKRVLQKLRSEHFVSIILIEQNLRMAAELSDRILKIERGIIEKEFIIDSSFNLNQLSVSIFN